ncbi:hypothetical protein GOODEAATRI_032178, partial [Goodea atripinnis]
VGVFMGKRDFVDRVDSVDPVDRLSGSGQTGGFYTCLRNGKVHTPYCVELMSVPACLLCPPVFVTLCCTFRYGRDDMDVMGMAFRRELYLSTRQVYPPLQDREKGVHTKVQAKLLRKLGNNAYPFFFEVIQNRANNQNQAFSVARHLLLDNLYLSEVKNVFVSSFLTTCLAQWLSNQPPMMLER